VLAAGLLAEAAVYLLAYQDVISNWWFIVLTAAVIGALPAAAKVLVPEEYGLPSRAAAEDEVPLELVGVDRPYTEADRELLDRELGLEGVTVGGAPRG
jgi:branched-chain amino acid transport system permease protein